MPDIHDLQPDLLPLRRLFFPPFVPDMIHQLGALDPHGPIPLKMLRYPVGMDSIIHAVLHLQHVEDGISVHNGHLRVSKVVKGSMSLQGSRRTTRQLSLGAASRYRERDSHRYWYASRSAANSRFGSLNALNSKQLPLGSFKKNVRCSPTLPAKRVVGGISNTAP